MNPEKRQKSKGNPQQNITSYNKRLLHVNDENNDIQMLFIL